MHIKNIIIRVNKQIIKIGIKTQKLHKINEEIINIALKSKFSRGLL